MILIDLTDWTLPLKWTHCGCVSSGNESNIWTNYRGNQQGKAVNKDSHYTVHSVIRLLLFTVKSLFLAIMMFVHYFQLRVLCRLFMLCLGRTFFRQITGWGRRLYSNTNKFSHRTAHLYLLNAYYQVYHQTVIVFILTAFQNDMCSFGWILIWCRITFYSVRFQMKGEWKPWWIQHTMKKKSMKASAVNTDL